MLPQFEKHANKLSEENSAAATVKKRLLLEIGLGSDCKKVTN